jgi:Tol biopolymer transport system component
MNRRQFLSLAAAAPWLAASACRTADSKRAGRRLFFTSDGRTAVVRSDGSELRYFDFKVPGQATWQPGPFLSDRRVIFLSMEPRRDGPGRPFEEYYTQTPTHLWVHDLDTGTLEEIANRERMAVFYTPALLLGDRRILVQVVRGKVGQIYSMNLDGTGAREFTKAGEGLPYGLSLSPDGRRVAFHLASPEGYQIWTSDLEGGNRIKVAAHPDHLYFGTSWSPDGRWILYQDCHYKSDPGHDWSDICIGRADGGGNRVLTHGQSQWFAATYGGPQRRGGGSNMPMWTRDGGIPFRDVRPARACRGTIRQVVLIRITSIATTSPRRPGVARSFAG